MNFNAANAKHLLMDFDFPKLFVDELGWDRHAATLQVELSGTPFGLRAVAEKRGMVAWLCSAPPGQRIPDLITRRKIERRVAKTTLEHLVVFTDDRRAEQIWCWARREAGKPVSVLEHFWYAGSGNRAFLQKLAAIAFSLQEEDGLTLVAVTTRARAAFDVERVTKRFYDQFKTEHTAFLGFVKGIADVADREWYASLMLNRMMFIYFMQRKGFLNGQRDYLRERLASCQREKGRDKFYSFYRYFLLRLFHEGLGGKERNPELDRLLGRIPYLNGGLFEQHPVEEQCPNISIPDEAFTRIFDYFDRYQWHLDERPLRNDDEINPDVLGYIFEKYINQKQMGAYYTKEDITEYICKNAVIPYLFDAAKARCKVAFENPGGPTIWEHLRDDPDRYIYRAVKHGVGQPLPDEIAAGVTDVASRGSWNKAAPAEFALPTEIWREVLARRARYQELRVKLSAGEVREINDLITLNLDIRQFAQDVIEHCEGPDLLRAFWKAIEGVTVLDPTCGSGAFLFAALNILEPLYETCLSRMEAFVADLDRSADKPGPKKFEDFKSVLAKVGAHPNARYFTLKSIILNNLFGVDIMEEAVEICKLRLFLKLAAQVEPDEALENLGIEPLPDIDFNIRAGNTLVGYATYADVKRALTSTFDFDNALDSLTKRAADLQQIFDAFRVRQIQGDGSVPALDKIELRQRLKAMEYELNRHLAGRYGVSEQDKVGYDKWLRTHEPFHWFVEFHGIMQRGGFDVVIGNPPYVSRTKISDYSTRDYETESCPDIYALCIERSMAVLAQYGRIGLIIPISFQFSEEYNLAREIVRRGSEMIWVSAYSRNPAALFNAGLGVRNTILLGARRDRGAGKIMSSRLYRWVEETRPILFEGIAYLELSRELQAFGWPRLDNSGIASLFETLVGSGGRLANVGSVTQHRLRFKTTALYYLSVFITDPPSHDQAGRPIAQTKIGQIGFGSGPECMAALAVAVGKIALLWWSSTGDDFDVTAKGLGGLPLSLSALPPVSLKKLGQM